MTKRFARTTAIIFGSGVLLVSYQNCAQHKFAPADELGSVSLASTVDTPVIVPDAPSTPNVPVVCDPFSSAGDVTCVGGLQGNVYYYRHGQGVNSYINYGKKLSVLVNMSHLNVPKRNWRAGFPTPGGHLRDENGDVLNEFFAFDLRGSLTLRDHQEGLYQFAIASDDGAILDIDGEKVVDNDGTHSVRWECSDNPVQLNRNQPKPMRLRYYQGPREEIALQVFWRPWSMRDRGCSEHSENGWKIVPASVLSH